MRRCSRPWTLPWFRSTRTILSSPRVSVLAVRRGGVPAASALAQAWRGGIAAQPPLSPRDGDVLAAARRDARRESIFGREAPADSPLAKRPQLAAVVAPTPALARTRALPSSPARAGLVARPARACALVAYDSDDDAEAAEE
jgi:hypothetical protein